MSTDVRLGDDSAAAIFVAVGSALSWWEGAEDALMGAFRLVCGELEEAAFNIYVGSNRGQRMRMMKSALETKKGIFGEEDNQKLLTAIKALDKLSEIRNQIAHGHCADYSSTSDGRVVMQGHFLMPSFNEGVWHERSPRYAHTSATIKAFEDSVRLHRWSVIEIWMAALERKQKSNKNLSMAAKALRGLSLEIVTGRMPAELALAQLGQITRMSE